MEHNKERVAWHSYFYCSVQLGKLQYFKMCKTLYKYSHKIKNQKKKKNK